jgi:hypothetical protein
MSFSSRGQNPLDLDVNLPAAGFVSTFCLHMGQTFLLASMWREECRHSEQKRWPFAAKKHVSKNTGDGEGGRFVGEGGEGTYHNA